MLGLYRGYIGLYWGYIRVILGPVFRVMLTATTDLAFFSGIVASMCPL